MLSNIFAFLHKKFNHAVHDEDLNLQPCLHLFQFHSDEAYVWSKFGILFPATVQSFYDVVSHPHSTSWWSQVTRRIWSWVGVQFVKNVTGVARYHSRNYLFMEIDNIKFIYN
jgi:hypothetical protein